LGKSTRRYVDWKKDGGGEGKKRLDGRSIFVREERLQKIEFAIRVKSPSKFITISGRTGKEEGRKRRRLLVRKNPPPPSEVSVIKVLVYLEIVLRGEGERSASGPGRRRGRKKRLQLQSLGGIPVRVKKSQCSITTSRKYLSRNIGGSPRAKEQVLWRKRAPCCTEKRNLLPSLSRQRDKGKKGRGVKQHVL